MRGTKAKRLRRERYAQIEEALDALLPTNERKKQETNNRRVIIVEGTRFDDILKVEISTEEEELEKVRSVWATLHPGDSIVNLIRMIKKDEE